jgi:hypothetical protein
MDIVPITTKLNDQIALMYGASMSLILRTSPTIGVGTVNHTLNGPAYIHGVMNCEVVD